MDEKIPIKTLNGHPLVDTEARELIENIDVVTDAHINELIDAKLGVIENGTY